MLAARWAYASDICAPNGPALGKSICNNVVMYTLLSERTIVPPPDAAVSAS